MRIKIVILTCSVFLLTSACGIAVTEKYKKQEEACIAQNPNSMTKRVECLNKAEEGMGDQHIRIQRQQVALALAKKVDSGELTQKEADRRYTLFIIDLSESEGQMRYLPTDVSQNFKFPPKTFTLSDEMRELILSRKR